MEILASDASPINRSYTNTGVICLVEFNGISHSIRVHLDSPLVSLKSYICGWYADLSSNLFNIAVSRGGITTAVDSDLVLQSLLALSMVRSEEFLVFKVMMHAPVVSHCNESASLVCASTCSSGICNEKGMECFTSGQSGTILREVNQVFVDVYDFRIQLMKHSLKTGYQLKMTKNDADKVSAVCKMRDKMNCKWRVYASLEYSGARTFSIKTFDSIHTCGAAFVDVDKFRVSSKLVKSVVIDFVRDKPLMTPKEVMDYFRHEYKYELNYYFAHAGLGLALKDINGDEATSFHELELYIAELEKCNPGSHMKFEMDSVTRQFKRVFISFGASIKGFRFCRPFIALDGTFLKNKYKGCLMAATGINGNQGIFQLAFGIVAGEDIENWKWFMNELKVVVGTDRKFTFISDRHPGILVAVAESFSQSYHSYCFYHLGLNLSSKLGASSKKKKASIAALEQICHSATLEEYNARVQRFSGIAGTRGMEFLSTLSADRYVDFCFPGSRYGYISSTIAESYNRWILVERFLPITSMVDKIRQKTMKMFSDRRDDAARWTTRLCPLKEKLLATRLEDGASWIGIKVQNFKWEILNEVSYIVNLVDRSCTCNQWKIEGFPCAHSLRAMKLERCDVYSYIDDFLFASSFRDSYADSIEPITKSATAASPPKELSVLPPLSRRQPGRPRKKRIPNTGSEMKRKISCGNCNESGRHNKRTCTRPPTHK